MLKTVMQALNERVSFPYRYGKLATSLTPLFDGVASVLDVGPGDGRLSRHLMETTGCHIIGIDVLIQPRLYVDVYHYNGRNFPFADNTFDCVLMVDMLHHTTDIEQMLLEARRVARRFVIIKDHYWDTRMELYALRAADYLGNIPYGVPLPYNFLSLAEWERLFRRHQLTEIDRSTFKFNRLEPARHITVKLQIEAAKTRPPFDRPTPEASGHAIQPPRHRVNGSRQPARAAVLSGESRSFANGSNR